MNNQPPDEKAIFNTARKLESPKKVLKYLNQVCGDDPQARNRIVELLRIHEQEKSFLESPPPGIDATLDSLSIAEKPGTQIGPFKLMEQIGEGGFGLVFVAEQQQPVRRKVALKIIKPGMDTKEVVARFEAERQALALMDHPNIARVLDAGATDSGRPYFVMELVRGIPVTDYCDRKRLTTDTRLRLFVAVCQAIQHAHQKGVIHRDVKPSNVLVTEHDGTPMCKVIDFGVAKAINQRLTEKTIYTRHQQLVGTPLYMSPEQAELSALDVDTRTDVYSLGVLLYELLTGVTPFDRQRLQNAAYDEMRRIIREEEPVRPSMRISTLGDNAETISELRDSEPEKLMHVLRGELDWIAMKALEKDRTRRYETALGLGQDVQRFLNQEPVHACPPKMGYHLSKLVRRHKTAFAFATSMMILLCAGIVGTTSGWRAEATARQEVEMREAEAVDARNREQRLRKSAETQRQKAEYGQYVMQIQAAAAHLELGNTFASQDALKDTLSANRNWEWGYLAQRAWTPPAIVNPSQRLVRDPKTSVAEFWVSAGPAEPVVPIQPGGIWIEAINVNHDGTQVAATLGNGSLRIWNTATGAEIWTSPIFGAVTPCVAFSRDNSRVACGGQTGEIWVWDLDTKKGLWNAPGVKGLSARKMWFSPDDSRLLVAYFEGFVGIWNVKTGQLVTDFLQHSGPVWSVQFHDDGKSVVAASVDGSVRVWDLETGKETKRSQSAPRREGMDAMPQAISPDLHTVATGYHDGTVIIWDLISDQRQHLFQGSDWIEDLVFSEDGTCLFVIEGQKRISMFDVNTRKRVNGLTDGRSSLRKVALSPQGDRFVTVGWEANCKIWAAVRTESEPRPTLSNGHDEVVLQATFSPDGKRIVTASYDKTIKVWDARTQELVIEFRGPNEWLRAAFDRSGRYVAGISTSGDVQVWDVETSKEMFNHPADHRGFLASASTDNGLRGNILDFSAVLSASPFAHDSNKIVVNGPNGMVVLDSRTGAKHFTFDYTGLKQIDSPPAGWPVIGPNDKCVAIITDGRNAAGKRRTHTELNVWDFETGRELFTLAGHKKLPFWVEFSPDGSQIVTGAMDGVAIVWDATNGDERLRLTGHGDSVVVACFSRDGKRVATAADDEAIVWDAATGDRLSSFFSPIRPITGIEFSPDGARVLTVATRSNAAVIWDPSGPEARELVRLTGERRLLYGTWSSDGQSILTSWDDGSVRLFEAVPWDGSAIDSTSIEDRVQAWRQSRSAS